MLQFTPLQTTDKDYSFVENLLHESFPEAERRDDVAQRDNVDNCTAFTCYLISDDELLVGLITVWKFAGFSYVEHLATSPSVRNKGYGRKIMEVLQQQFPGVIILEVENRWTNGVAGVSVFISGADSVYAKRVCTAFVSKGGRNTSHVPDVCRNRNDRQRI